MKIAAVRYFIIICTNSQSLNKVAVVVLKSDLTLAQSSAIKTILNCIQQISFQHGDSV